MTENNLLPPPVIETPEKREVLKPLKPKFKFSPIFLIIVLSLFFVSTILAAYYYGISKNSITNVLPTPTITLPTIAVSPTDIPVQANTGEFGTLTWNSSPKKIANPLILTSSTTPDFGAYTFADLGTYEVAKFSKGATLILTFVIPDGPSSPIPFRLISDKGKYYLIESLINDDYIKKNLDAIFDQNKVKFISYQIKELYYDNQYFINKIFFSVANDSFSPQFITGIKNYKVAVTTPVGDILMIEEPVYNFSGISNRNYYLKLHDFSLVPFKKASTVASTDNQVPYFNFLDNSPNKSQFSPMRSGCGGGINSTVISDSPLLNSKTLIGKSDSTEIFQVMLVDSPLVKYLYEQYKSGRDYPSAPPFLPIDKFAEAPNHIIFQEKTGEWTLLINPEYTVQAECGKPVIYLYPEKDTQVSVKVGADITKSEPLYSDNGWTVLAHPSGQLDYQGQVYPNLFWEGTGKGFYPNLTNYGFVVAQKDLISVLNSQLRDLGLNAKESADFMEFWTDKLPTTPYVRLTWLGTPQMNQLAPLSVIPRPDTSIRIFLDFAGLDKPIKLIPQKLSAPSRRGFTLVEWGGLLIK